MLASDRGGPGSIPGRDLSVSGPLVMTLVRLFILGTTLTEKPIDAGYDQQPGRLCAKRVRQPALA